MPTPVVMPQMGESIAEGTIVRWIKKVGDQVDRDEPLFEISTDKVDAEVPSPAAGVLTDIAVKEGETVPVNSVVATIGQAGDVAPRPAPTPPPTQAQGDGSGASARQAAAPPPAPSKDDLRRQKSSPLVRRIARENDVDITRIPGSGIGGRVTKRDILEFLERDTAVPARDSGTGARAPEAQPVSPESRAPGPETRPPGPEPRAAGPEPRVPGLEGRAPSPESRIPSADRVEVRPLSPIRRKIAEHMILSRRTSAHVHSVFHVDFSEVERIRREKKADYERLGARLTYMAFIAKAVTDAIRRQPIVNASLDGDNVILKKDVNLGIAVALEDGLIVPVIRNADEKNLLGLSRAIADLAERARTKQLKPEEVQGGTFTITNPGQFGSQFGMPIINQPQVAILGVGTIEKRPVVVDEAIAIRTMAYLTLGYDHRLVDGAVADQFMSDVKRQIEHFDASQV